MTDRFVFVLEQTLGHVAHARNIQRALSEEQSIRPTLIKLSFEHHPPALKVVPGGGNWSLRASAAARSALRRRLAEGAVDALFVHTQVASLLSVGVMRRVPTVLSLDATPKNFDDVGLAYRHRRQARPVEWFKASINRRPLHAAQAIVTWSELAARSVASDYGVDRSRVSVIRPGVDLELFRPAPRVVSADGMRLLFVGGDFVRKGGPDLLEAMRALPHSVQLDVVTGSRVLGVPAGVTCRVHGGLRPGDPRLLELYRAADVFVLPSRGDCLPQVLAEAAASALPIVAADTGAVSEIVKPGATGLLVPQGAPRELASALRFLLDNPRLRAALGQESLSLARAEHDAGRNNRRIFELMRRLSRAARPLAAAATAAVAP
jgi:glycosyltransferase involved in cell wall biosynthesis